MEMGSMVARGVVVADKSDKQWSTTSGAEGMVLIFI